MPAPSWLGQTIGRRYKIEALLGQGGMSSVYKAIDPNLRRTIAIKLIHAHLATDTEFVRRFEEEAAAVAQLRHPNIIQVYDFNHDEGTYFMVLEFVQGETLFHRLQQLHSTGRRIPIDEVVSLMITICDAVQYAHDRGLIHRDLKPANVILNTAGQPILMDFGVAKIVGGARHTATGAVVGTPTYISPEQVRGHDIDHRADIYALGVMLFEMIAGRVPFDADTALSLMLKHVNDPVPDVRPLNPDVPEELVAVIQKALAKQPENRYQSARDMGAALSRVRLAPAELHASGIARPITPPRPPPTTPPPSPKGTQVFPEPGGTRVEKSRSRSVLPILIGIGALAVVVFVGVVVLGLVGGWLFFGGDQPTSVAISTETNTEVPVSTTQEGTATEIPAATTETASLTTGTIPPAPTETSTPIPVPAGMALIQAGFFQMGSSTGRADEQPEHPVLLSAVYLDTTEVTNAMYRNCVQAGHCTPSSSPRQNDTAFDNYPVVLVNWHQADAYCRAADKRLPIEAEWEYAASGPNNFIWPWGNTFDPSLTSTSSGDSVVPVRSFPGGASPFGLFDMAGNAAEWVADAYSTTFYAESPASNPFNGDGDARVYRGGSFGTAEASLYTTSRRFAVPASRSDVDIGFRCAKDAVEVNAALPEADHETLVRDFCQIYAAYKPGAPCP